MKRNVGALVLAAGFSRRFGSDKRFAGSPALILRTIHSITPFFHSVWVIHRAHDPELRTLLSSLPVSLIAARAEHCALGTSISDGINHIITHSNISHCALFLADMPSIKGETIEQVLAKTEDNIVRPKYQGQSGHPVIFARRFFVELTQLTYLLGAQRVIDLHRDCLITIPTWDPGVILDIDNKDDLYGKCDSHIRVDKTR